MSALLELFNRAERPLPQALADWESRVNDWCTDYGEQNAGAEISEICLEVAVYLFDHLAERVTLAYALSVEQLMRRDSARMRGFPDVNASVRASTQLRAFDADKGHFLGHASGGILDINLFPHRRDLNRGWSAQGKRFRKMERYVEHNPGTFFYHRPIYDDGTWVPKDLEYGVLLDGTTWWIETFRNK